MAPPDDRRGQARPGSEPADRSRPIRASQRARLRGLDGVRRDDVYGAGQQDGAAQGSRAAGSAAQGTGPAGSGASGTGPRSSGQSDSSSSFGASGSAPQSGAATAPSHTESASASSGRDASDRGPRSWTPFDEATQAFPSRRARREAQARQKADEQTAARHTSRGGTVSGSSDPTGPAAATGSSRSDRSAAPTRAVARTADEAGPTAPRHSRRAGDAFPSIVRWTTLGTLLPGLGMIRGRSRGGWILLLGFLAGILAILAWVAWRSPIKAIARIAGSPTILYTVAVVLLIGIVIWAFTILRSYSVLKRGKRMTQMQRWLGWGLVGSLIVCVGVPLGIGAAYTKVQGDTVIQVFGRDGKQGVDIETLWGDTERINVFLIGRDSGDGREGTRPDTMLVASITPATGDATLISVPRNLNHAQFPEGTALAERFPYGFDGFGPEESLINAVWTWAEQNADDVGEVPPELDVGMEATMQAVEGSLGLPLDYYASVDMQGFEDVVDAIGGVKIDVERPIPMGGGTNLNTGLKNPIHGWIDPGEQTLTGAQALWYVRSRDGSDNYDRMCRQQRMLKLTIDQVNPQELAIAYPKLAGSAGRNILTDIAQSEVSAFVELAAQMQGAEIKSAQITNDVVSTTNPDYDVLHQWVQDQVNPAEPSQAEQEASEEPTDEAPEEEPTEEPTGAPAAGIEDDEGKCYPKGYTPGSGWPGWPGGEDAAGTDGA